ncbi:MAG: aminotransferase class IV [Parvibaculales bacterium]
MIWVNGQIQTDVAIGADNRGFLLGDGVFETMLIVNHQPLFIARHLARLYESLNKLSMPPRFTQAEIIQACDALIKAMQIDAGRHVLRLTVTRNGGRGLDMSSHAKDQLWLMTLAPTAPAATSYRLITATACRPSHALTSQMKSTNYLENILARKQAKEKGADEALMLNEHGRIACAAAGNIFIHIGNNLLTPPIEEGALAGTRRQILLDCHQEIKKASGLEIKTEAITQDMVRSCDSAFVTNSLQGCVPVTEIDDYALAPTDIKKSPAMQAILNCFNQAD